MKEIYSRGEEGRSTRDVSADTTHELYELMSIKKILDSFRGGTYYVALNKYVDDRVMQLLEASKKPAPSA